MEKLNKYEIEGRTYKAVNEHDAVKAAYKMAKNFSLKKYIGNDVWVYDANFSNGKAEVIVRRIVSPAAALGSIKSPRKAASSRENGKKGGRPCNHCAGDGGASDYDRKRYCPGDECASCGCTLGDDWYWYIDRDQAPGYPDFK